MALHVYQNSVIESVVAESREEAVELLRAYLQGLDADEMDLVLTQRPDSDVARIAEYDGHEGEQHTMAEWAAINGKGFLCSTEY